MSVFFKLDFYNRDFASGEVVESGFSPVGGRGSVLEKYEGKIQNHLMGFKAVVESENSLFDLTTSGEKEIRKADERIKSAVNKIERWQDCENMLILSADIEADLKKAAKLLERREPYLSAILKDEKSKIEKARKNLKSLVEMRKTFFFRGKIEKAVALGTEASIALEDAKFLCDREQAIEVDRISRLIKRSAKHYYQLGMIDKGTRLKAYSIELRDASQRRLIALEEARLMNTWKPLSSFIKPL